jgi:hypothetical protein
LVGFECSAPTFEPIFSDDLFAWVGFIMYIPASTSAAAQVREGFQELKRMMMPLMDQYD